MSSHRRFIASQTYAPMDVGPVAYYEGGGTEQGGYGITTDLSQASKSGGGFATWLDYLWGGFEQEDIAASPTAGGVNIYTGQPVDPNAAASVAESIGKPDYWPGEDKAPSTDVNWRNLAITVVALGGGFLLWKSVVEPRLQKKDKKETSE